jgi:hypothetical protein
MNQTPGGPLVRALRARAGILLLITQRIFHRFDGNGALKYTKKATTKNSYTYFKEVRQKIVIYNVITIGFYPSSIN